MLDIYQLEKCGMYRLFWSEGESLPQRYMRAVNSMGSRFQHDYLGEWPIDWDTFESLYEELEDHHFYGDIFKTELERDQMIELVNKTLSKIV